ncbi:MLL5 protein [Trichophyton equinum CBS 127.97]|uniref:MLL5 protein n=1 Tax=Trichophyton equinum (strain ATCC MYA-4606 / CBS 127.97) TaxID=559882 RepID=F2PJM5_TRIEC|nr:MLL5 protein [Trichophyton equinum CBS 127.97]
MTDTSSTAHAHSTANPFPFPATTSPLPSPVANGTGSTHEAEEDEPYTIKCICSFEDDDGSTVLCERCDTWQHIACYYIDKKNVPDIHNCVDCEPRHLDGKRATERQRKLREQNDSNSNATDEQRKSRRSGSKSQKKKPKDIGSPSGVGGAGAGGEQRNGWSSHERAGSTTSKENGHHHHQQGQQLQQTKKQRGAHRSSNSISSVGGGDSRKRGNNINGKSPGSSFPQIPLYSPEFLHLYDNDNASLDMQGNLFRTIGLTNDLASWVKDPLALAQVANGRSAKEVFNHTDQPLDPSTWPPLTKQTIVDNHVEIDGRHPTWQCLKVQSNVRKDEIVGEVKGKVGHFRDYCHDPDSRWQELRHPEPFVFFHPQLPIYIDSREEGTVLRYIRRSCRPNVTMRTYITNQVEYHFCFVANQDIPMDTEISTTWYLDPKMFPSNGLVKEEGLPDGSPDAAAISISNVLAHFGGCACDDSVKPCLLANIDCRMKPKSLLESNTKQANGRRKKAKTKTAASPDSSGYVAVHSRSGSEIVRKEDDDDHADARSTSGSLKDHSNRDLTPGALGRDNGELSAREKRKIAAAEKKFEQLEHDQQHPKKKKRVHPPRGQSPNLSKSAKPPHLDIPNSRRSSHSPAKMSPESASQRRDGHFTPPKTSAASTPRVVSPLSRPVYIDRSIQTDPDENDPQYVPPKPFPAPRFMTLSQRLLRRCLEDRIKMEEDGRLDSIPSLDSSETTSAGTMLPPSTPVNSRLAPSPKQAPDIEMKDADSSMTPPNAAVSSASPTTTSSVSLSSPPPCPLFHLPSTVAHNLPTPRKIPGKPDVRIPLPPQLPPPPDSVGSPDSASKPAPPIAVTKPSQSSKLETTSPGQPAAATPTPTPTSSLTAPSPVKKKLSLNDYMSRRGTLTTPTTEKAPNPFLPNSTSPAPSTGSADPSPTTQLPFTKFAETQAQTNGLSQNPPASTDIIMKDSPQSPSTLFPPPSHTDSPSTSNGTKSNSIQGLSSRDPRLLDRG